MTDIPLWMRTIDGRDGPPRLSAAGRKARRQPFFDKTLHSISQFIRNSFISEKFALHNGPFQKIHPRVKIVIFTMLIVSMSLSRSSLVLFLMVSLFLALAAISGIPFAFFARRILIFPVFFTSALAIPASLNFVTPGNEIFIIITSPFRLSVTSQGVSGAILLFSRVLSSVSLVALLVLTTRWNVLLDSLSFFRVPAAFTTVLQMSYRYLFYLVKIVEDIHLAMKSRFISVRRPSRGSGWVASRVGFLFNKSLHLTENVHLAMISRGYSGQSRTLSQRRVSMIDYLWLLATISLSIFIIMFGRMK